jgi:hypothetical protein
MSFLPSIRSDGNAGNHGLIITIGDFVPPDAVFAFQLLFISANMILQNPSNRNPFPCCIGFFFFSYVLKERLPGDKIFSEFHIPHAISPSHFTPISVKDT